MEPWLGPPSNASSLHEDGRRARATIDESRERISKALGCLFGEVVFTSSGTEAANLALIGAALGNTDLRRNRVLVSAAEHHCVLNTRPLLERLGCIFETLPVTTEARLEPEELWKHVGDDVLLVSVMAVNNELGSVNEIDELAAISASAGALFHTDAVQTFPFECRADDVGADLISFSSHKCYGPTGVGGLYIRSGTSIDPVAVGGGQEREMRAGTENVAAIAGFAAAVDWCSEKQRGSDARNTFASKLQENGFIPTVQPGAVADNHFHCRLPGIDADTMLIRLDRLGVSASSGAACSSGSLEASHVLLACGYSPSEAKEGLRFTFGLDTGIADAQEAANRVVQASRDILETRQKT